MQVNKFFLGLFACASLCACSNDGLLDDDDDISGVFTGDEAYISVRLTDAGTSTRAAGDPDYEYGSEGEHAIQNAYFYFYDASGVFVAEGSAWNGGNASTGTPAESIEFKGNTVVVLKGLKKKNYPKYMVTVLNRPVSVSTQGNVPFAPGNTLDEMEEKLADDLSAGITVKNGETDYFVMSTTSWAGQTNSEGRAMKYFVTEVEEKNFSLEPITAGASNNYVTVYVERLAAKVTLKISPALTSTDIAGKTCYGIKATVAGEGNDDDTNENGGNQIAAESLYVELLGWKLNATAKKSRIVKNIDETWTDANLGFVWNNKTDKRSFWGKSFNYALTGYPENAAGASASQYLDYFNLNDPLDLGTSDYCAENTNTSAVVTDNYPSAVTSILLKAKVYDKDGNALDLVRFNGVLFKKAVFIEYMLNVMKAKNIWNVWVKTSADGATPEVYEQIGADYLKLANVGDGEVKVQLNVPENVALYSRADAEGGGYTYAKITDFTTVNNNLETESADAIGYNGGLMYYNIPIEHLNNTAVTTDPVTGNVTSVPEAKYGVVRNHHYVVTVNKLENMGKGIFEPEEVIVPGKDDDKETYYVGANINILSWRIVSQDVDL